MYHLHLLYPLCPLYPLYRVYPLSFVSHWFRTHCCCSEMTDSIPSLSKRVILAACLIFCHAGKVSSLSISVHSQVNIVTYIWSTAWLFTSISICFQYLIWCLCVHIVILLSSHTKYRFVIFLIILSIFCTLSSVSSIYLHSSCDFCFVLRFW